MKISHYLKPRDETDMAYALNSGSARNTYWATFGQWPSDIQWRIENAKKPQELDLWAKSEGFSVEVVNINIINPSEERYSDKHNTAFIHNDKKIILISSLDGSNKMSISMFFPVELQDYAIKAQKITTKKIGTQKVTGKINLMAVEQGDFFLMSLDIPRPEMNIELNYGSTFGDVHNDIRTILDAKDSGLILLHGVSGSGKSTYIYHIIHEFPHKMIFIPNSMVSSIANPDFVNFLLSNAKDSVLIVEDAEKVLLKRGGSGDSGVSTLLNITDGILGKLLRCKVICTFNVARTELDTALLRKGRLRKEHEFKALEPEDANKLLKYLGKDRQTDKPLVLADIYNEAGGREINEGKLGF